VRILWLALLLGACGAVKEDMRDVTIIVKTSPSALRVHCAGQYLGRAPVRLTRQLVIRQLDNGVRRWFLGGEEVFPGGSWILKIETFKQGVRIPVDIVVPFDPAASQVEVLASS
jgi:hypothetical protein